MSYVLQGGTFTRTFQAAELETLSLKLIGSQQSYFKTDGIAVILLSELGYLLLMQVDGVGSTAARTLFENYTFHFDASYEHSVRLTSKTLSGNATFSQALVAQSYSGLSPLTDLNTLHALTYLVPPPGPPRYWALDNSEETLHMVRRETHNHTHRTQFNDHAQEDLWLFTLAKTFITNNYQPATLSLNGNACSVITTRALEIEDLGSGAFLIGGPTALQPLITLSVSSPYTVQAQTGTTLTVPSASAVDPLTSGALSVQANPGTVDLGVLGTTVVTYTCTTSAGDLSSALLDLVVVDTTSPVLTLLGASTVNVVVGATYGSAEDAGASALDNYDGDLTSSIVTTGLPVNTTAASTQTVTYSVVDSQNLSASITRSIVIAPASLFTAAGPWTSPAWYSTGLGTSLTGETNLLGGGTGYGYEVVFSYKRSTDPQGVIFAITDSSTSSTYYETPSTTAAVAFRIDATAGVKVRFPQSHPTWNNSRYHGDAAGVTNSNQTSWTEVTLRVWDKDSSNWGLFLSVGSNSYTRDMAKSGTGSLFIPGNTSTWTGYAVNCVETAGAVTTSASWKVTPGGEVKDISISPYTAP